jgi:hypothetical protein
VKRAPTLAAVDAVETRLAESRTQTREALQRVRVAMRASVPQRSTVVVAAGAIGLVGLWLARRSRGPTVAAKVGAGVAVSATVAALGRALLARYGVRGATLVLARARAAWQRRAERAAAEAAATARSVSVAAGVSR